MFDSTGKSRPSAAGMEDLFPFPTSSSAAATVSIHDALWPCSARLAARRLSERLGRGRGLPFPQPSAFHRKAIKTLLGEEALEVGSHFGLRVMHQEPGHVDFPGFDVIFGRDPIGAFKKLQKS